MQIQRWRTTISLWLMLGLLSLGLQSTWAAEEADYRFERMLPQLAQPWYFSEPHGIAVAADGSVWVADSDNHRLQHFKADGSFIAQFVSKGSDAGQFNYPYGIAVAADGSVWVADSRRLSENAIL